MSEYVPFLIFSGFMLALMAFLGWAARIKVNGDFVRDWDRFSQDWDRRNPR